MFDARFRLRRVWVSVALAAGLSVPALAFAGPQLEITGGLPVFRDVALKPAPLQTTPVTPGTLTPKAGDGTATIGITTQDAKSLGSVKAGQKVEILVGLGKEFANASGFQVVLKFDPKLWLAPSGKKDGSAFASAIDLPAQTKGDSVTYGASILGGTTTAKGALAILTFEAASGFSGDTEITLSTLAIRIGGVPTTLTPGASVVLSSSALAGSGMASDFDGTGVVDFDDFFLFAAAFGKKQGEAGFDARYDLGKNGEVDFDDFFIFAGDFGKTK